MLILDSQARYLMMMRVMQLNPHEKKLKESMANKLGFSFPMLKQECFMAMLG